MFSDVPRISAITKNMVMPTNSSVIYNTTTNTYEFFDGVSWVPFTNFNATGEPTGFPLGSDGQIDLSSSFINFTNSNRTFTISPTIDSFYFYHNGREFRKVNPESIKIDDIEGLHYIYFDSEGIIRKSTTFSYDLILKNVFVAIIYWNSTDKKYIYVGEERHGCTMDAHTHARIHAESGAVYISGMTPNFNYANSSVIDGNGGSPSNLGFAISDGYFRDEDIIHYCSLTDFNINIPIFFRTADNVWRRREGGESVISYRLLFDSNKNIIQYNKKNENNAYTLETPDSGKFILYHLYAINDANINKSGNSRDNKYALIVGTQQYDTKNEARYNAINEISEMDNFPFIEMVAIGSFIYEHNINYTNIAKARLVSVDGDNFIDWRKKLNLKPLNALANSHNYHGGIYGQAPFYHSNQPISTNDEVAFKNITINNLKIRNSASGILTSGIIDLKNSSNLIFNFDMIDNHQNLINFINGTPGEVFYVRIRNGQNPFIWGNHIKWLSETNQNSNSLGKYDVFHFICTSSTEYYGSALSSLYLNQIGDKGSSLVSNGNNFSWFNLNGGSIQTINMANEPSGNIDLSQYNTNAFKIENPGSLNLINGIDGRWYSIVIVSDGMYQFGDNCKFPLENAQPIPSTAGQIDLYSFLCINNNFLSTFAYGYTGVY